MVRLTLEQRAFLVQRYFEKAGRPNSWVLDQFSARFTPPGAPEIRPSETALENLIHKFRTEYTIEDTKRTRTHPATNEDQQELVLAGFAANPHSSQRKMAQEVGISKTSVRNILKTNSFHPYKIQLLHKMNEDDPDRRIQFCEEMIERNDQNPDFNRRTCFSDEATFKLNGEVNRHNMRFWSAENPHWNEATKSQGEDKVSIL